MMGGIQPWSGWADSCPAALPGYKKNIPPDLRNGIESPPVTGLLCPLFLFLPFCTPARAAGSEVPMFFVWTGPRRVARRQSSSSSIGPNTKQCSSLRTARAILERCPHGRLRLWMPSPQALGSCCYGRSAHTLLKSVHCPSQPRICRYGQDCYRCLDPAAWACVLSVKQQRAGRVLAIGLGQSKTGTTTTMR